MKTDIAPNPVPREIGDSPIPFDLYREVHKGLRHALFELTVTVGRADGADPRVRADVIAGAERVIRLLHAHHGHEDTFIQACIEVGDPGLAAIIEEGHAETVQDLAQIDVQLARLAGSVAGEAVAAGHELYCYLALFTARYLAHMALEEGAVMESLRSSMALEELFAVEVALRSAVAPPLMVEFMAVMLPAMTTDERTNMLGGMKAGAPADVFELFRGAAQAALSAGDYAVVASRIGLA